MNAFECKTWATLARFEGEVDAGTQGPLDIGDVTLGCMLGYIDFRFETLGWEARVPRLAQWYERVAERPSFMATSPVLDS